MYIFELYICNALYSITLGNQIVHTRLKMMGLDWYKLGNYMLQHITDNSFIVPLSIIYILISEMIFPQKSLSILPSRHFLDL